MIASFYTKRQDDKAFIKEGLKDVAEVHFFESADQSPHPETEIISVFTDVPVPRALIEALPKLRLIAVRATGVDHIDLVAAKEKGIKVAHVSGYGSTTVAEYAILLTLMIARRMQTVLSESCKYDPNRAAECGVDLSGKTMGIAGTGAIGAGVARIAKGIGMSVLGYDAYPDQKKAEEIGFTYVDSPEELIKNSDVLSLHMPLLNTTRHFLNSARIAQMKQDAILINTARGELVDTPALVATLKSGNLHGVGLDVIEEGIDQEALRSFDNVVITNHNAYNTSGALERINQKTIDNIHAFLGGGAFDEVK